MKLTAAFRSLLICFFMVSGFNVVAQDATKQTTQNKNAMNTYVIEREIPNAGSLTQEELKGISQKSCAVLKEMGPKIEWVHSYVTGNKIYCIYRAESEELVRQHAAQGGFPANSVAKVSNIISPGTATN